MALLLSAAKILQCFLLGSWTQPFKCRAVPSFNVTSAWIENLSLPIQWSPVINSTLEGDRRRGEWLKRDRIKKKREMYKAIVRTCTEQKNLICVWRQGEEKVREARPTVRQVGGRGGEKEGGGYARREMERRGGRGVRGSEDDKEDAQMTREREREW